jgi:1,4-alpha-glucan branching enzyme
MAAGELTIVLHAHMPYVEGYDSWPFGEEWLWEAMACCYLPLAELLAEGAPLTLSLTPVLADQLCSPGVGERFDAFLAGVRRRTHGLDIEQLPEHARELERAASDYERWLGSGAELASRLLAHASWTSAATHAVLPLCASDAGVRLQVASGIAAHRARTECWEGGFWLPECAYAPWLEPLLAAAGVRASCLDLTDHFGAGASKQLRPLRAGHGPTMVPIDRQTIELVWSDRGYPAHASYRDYHHRTPNGHHAWANGGRPYDHAAALEQARLDAADFISRVQRRVAGGGLCVCAFDAELFGHWWYEGITFLRELVAQAAAAGVPLATLDDALRRHQPAEVMPESLGTGSWGTPRDLSSWDCPAAAELLFVQRSLELRVLATARSAGAASVRELLGAMASDWTFLTARARAGDYPHRRVMAHARAAGEVGSPGPRNLAPFADASPLLEP